MSPRKTFKQNPQQSLDNGNRFNESKQFQHSRGENNNHETDTDAHYINSNNESTLNQLQPNGIRESSQMRKTVETNSLSPSNRGMATYR